MDKKLINTLRWMLRIVSGLFIVFFLLMFIGETFFDDGRPDPKPWTFNEIFQLSVFGIGMIGFIIAWKWELMGGIIALVAYIGVAIINPTILNFSLIYIYPLTAILFIVLWAISRKTSVNNEQIKRQ